MAPKKTAADSSTAVAQDAAAAGNATAVAASSAYQPVGELRVLAEVKRAGRTIRVLQDDVRAWKEVE